MPGPLSGITNDEPIVPVTSPGQPGSILQPPPMRCRNRGRLLGVPVTFFFALGMFGAVYAGPMVDQQDLHRCGIDFNCSFDWRGSGYDDLVPWHYCVNVRSVPGKPNLASKKYKWPRSSRS